MVDFEKESKHELSFTTVLLVLAVFADKLVSQLGHLK